MTIAPHTADKRDAAIVAELLKGRSARAIARDLEVGQRTVRQVRDRPDVREKLAAARLARAAAHDAIIDDARRILREAAPEAALALADAVAHPDPQVRLRAAAQLLDRIGVPRVEEVRQRSLDLPDLSKLTDDELAQWEALNAKVSPA